MFFYLEDCKTAVSLSSFVKRAQVEHKRSLNLWNWDFYKEKTKNYAWLTSHYRFIAIGPKAPRVALEEGEIMMPLEVPWDGNGQQMASLINYHRRRKAIKTPTYARDKCGKLKTVAELV